MNQGVRWAIVAVVLMVAGIVAIWPRSPEPLPEATVLSAPDLTEARAEAGLPACDTDAEGPADLRGITAECLGNGKSVDIASTLRGPVLVNMWATWCTPCKTELPILAEYAREPGAIEVVTLGVESKAVDALTLLTKLDVRLPSLLDEDGRARRELHAVGLPASYLVGVDGSIKLIENPRVFRSVDEVRQAVANG